MLSTLHNDDAIDDSTEEKKKPEIIPFYNMAKKAVETVDKKGSKLFNYQNNKEEANGN